MNEIKCVDPQDDIGYLIWQILKFWQRGKHRILDEFGITASQLEVMGAIYHLGKGDKEVTQIILSQETNIDPMTVSTILRNLQKKGLIDRTESKTDTRARSVEITKQGNELFVKAIARVKEQQDHLFKNIDTVALKKQLRILLAELNKKSEKDKCTNNQIN